MHDYNWKDFVLPRVAELLIHKENIEVCAASLPRQRNEFSLPIRALTPWEVTDKIYIYVVEKKPFLVRTGSY